MARIVIAFILLTLGLAATVVAQSFLGCGIPSQPYYVQDVQNSTTAGTSVVMPSINVAQAGDALFVCAGENITNGANLTATDNNGGVYVSLKNNGNSAPNIAVNLLASYGHASGPTVVTVSSPSSGIIAADLSEFSVTMAKSNATTHTNSGTTSPEAVAWDTNPLDLVLACMAMSTTATRTSGPTSDTSDKAFALSDSLPTGLTLFSAYLVSAAVHSGQTITWGSSSTAGWVAAESASIK